MNDWLLSFFGSEHIDLVLFASAFLSATILPGSSEVFLAGGIAADPSRWLALIAIATAGNTLGSMTGWCIGRFIPEKEKEGRALRWLHKYGIWAVLLCWLPLVGDALSIAAGWLRFNPAATMALIAVGKAARYVAVAWVVLPFAS